MKYKVNTMELAGTEPTRSEQTSAAISGNEVMTTNKQICHP
jgi:hypothetical protein